MKKVLLLFLISGFTFFSQSQEIRVKKGIVYQDDVPVMKMDGKCGMFTKLKFSFLSLNGDTLFNMQEKQLGYKDPRNAPLFWFDLDFLNKKATLKMESHFVKEKQVARFLLSLKPVFIKSNSIDTAALTQFISNNDYTNFIVSDTASCFEFERKQKKHLDDTKWTRDMKKEIIIRVSEGNHNLYGFRDYEVFDVIQDGIIIGIVVKKHMRYMQNYYSDYYFLKRLITPFEHKGIIHSYGLVAYVEGTSVRNMKYIYEKNKPLFSLKDNTTTPEYDISIQLLQTGCLN